MLLSQGRRELARIPAGGEPFGSFSKSLPQIRQVTDGEFIIVKEHGLFHRGPSFIAGLDKWNSAVDQIVIEPGDLILLHHSL